MNGFKEECICGKDENGCDNTLEDLIHSLATGLLVISILAFILEYRKEMNKITSDTDLTDFQQRDQGMDYLEIYYSILFGSQRCLQAGYQNFTLLRSK